MAFYDLWNFAESFHSLVEIFRMLQVQSYIGASFVSDFFRVDNKLRPLYNSEVRKFLYALVYCGTANVACSCHLKKWNSCIICNQSENFFV